MTTRTERTPLWVVPHFSRLQVFALLRGEIEAATLLDPEIAIAEARGLRGVPDHLLGRFYRPSGGPHSLFPRAQTGRRGPFPQAGALSAPVGAQRATCPVGPVGLLHLRPGREVCLRAIQRGDVRAGTALCREVEPAHACAGEPLRPPHHASRPLANKEKSHVSHPYRGIPPGSLRVQGRRDR